MKFALLSPSRSRRRLWLLTTAGALLAGGGIAAVLLLKSPEVEKTEEDIFHVKRGPLTISVSSSGNIRSSEAEVIKNKVEGRTSILWIVEEGSRVQKGDKLIELDSSALKDQKVNQEILVGTEEANLVSATENLEIAKKQGEADVKAAKVALQLAVLDLEKYTGASVSEILNLNRSISAMDPDFMDMAEKLATVKWTDLDVSQYVTGNEGEYAKELQVAENNITLAESERERARDRMEGSHRLAEKGYITENEMLADELEYDRKNLAFQVAQSEKRLLSQYTRKRKLSELLSAVDQQSFLLEKARHQANANVTNAESVLSAAKSSYGREKEKLDKLTAQIEYCTIYSPVDGMVVYGTTGQERSRDQPLDEGVEVRERQVLFRLPTVEEMVADIKIHESMLKQITLDLPVVLTTEALAGRRFSGRISKIAVMPDSQSRWLNPDLRVYNAEVLVEDDSGALRPGMSCEAEVIIERFSDALYVPVESVLLVKGKPTVYMQTPDGALPQEVEVGLNNNEMCRIKSGLQEGDPVMLYPPLPPAARQQSQMIQFSKSGETQPGAGRPGAGNTKAAAN